MYVQKSAKELFRLIPAEASMDARGKYFPQLLHNWHSTILLTFCLVLINLLNKMSLAVFSDRYDIKTGLKKKRAYSSKYICIYTLKG